MDEIAIGIDLAWSPKNSTGLAAAVIDALEIKVLATTTAKTNAEILDFVRPYASGVLTIAIDAPTIVPNKTGMRPVERELQRDKSLQRAHATPYPGNRQRLGECNSGVPRGEELVGLLHDNCQVQEVGLPPTRHTSRYVMEVFPLPAMVRLFNLTAPLPYKAKKGRTPEQRRTGLKSVIERLGGLAAPSLLMPDSLRVNGESGAKLKGIEDRIDAVVCAYLAALAWLGEAEYVGDTLTGYMVMPQARIENRVRNELAHVLSPRFSEALLFAADIHRQQSRKGTEVPYIAHVIGVASLALEYGAKEDEAIAALLHDAIEDAPAAMGATAVRGWVRLKFGERVLEIVEGCTDTDENPKPPWRVRKEQYVARIAHEPPSVLLVSIADKLHNVRALQKDYRAVGEALWSRFNPEAGRMGTLGYYRGLVTAYTRRLEKAQDARVRVLVEGLDREVGALEDLVGARGQWPLTGL